MSSVGQALGMAAGAVIGAFIPGGYILLGAAIGGAIGGAIDPPKGPNMSGPRLSDLRQQTSTYGLAIPRCYGTVAVGGNIFWIENNELKEVASESEQGGKGGGGATVTEYTYYGTFAVGLCQGPVAAIKRIWLGGQLWYSGISDDTGTIIESSEREQFFTVYYGTDDQLPDPRMQAALGVDNCPAYRGLCYLVFKDFELTNYGNTIAGLQIKVEVVAAAASTIKFIERNYDFTAWPTTGAPQILGVVDGLIEVQEKWATGLTRRYLPSGLVLTDTVQRPPGYPDLPAGWAGAIDWSHVGNFYGNSYLVRHSAFYDCAGLGSGVLAIGELHADGCWRLDGFRIDQDIVAARIADGLSSAWWPTSVAIDVRGLGLLVIDSDLRWYFIDPLGTMIERGTVDPGTIPHYDYLGGMTGAFGPTSTGEMSGTSGSRCATFDSSIMRYVNNDNGFLYARDIRDGVMSLTAFASMQGDGLGINETGNSASIYMQGSLVFVIIEDTLNSMVVVDFDYLDETATSSVRAIVEAECALSRTLVPADVDAAALDKEVTGYRIGSVGAIRAPLEQLQAYYPFDAHQNGYQIKFVPRGGASVATFDHVDLVQGDGDERAILTTVREMDSQLPVRVAVKHLDAAREYDVGEQYAERCFDQIANLREIELPVVMTPDQAAGIAETLLYLYWLERYDLSFTLAPTLDGRKVQPTDVVTVTTDDENHVVRLVAIEEMADGQRRCAAKLAGQSLYTPAAMGETPITIPPTVLTPAGPTTAALLDLPYMMTGMDAPGFVGAMFSPLATWPGGAFYNSNDGGATWSPIQATTASATAGVATTTLAAPYSYEIIDAKNSVTVRLNSGTMESVTALQLAAGANHFALGAHGRWEICAAQTVVDNGNRSYTLTNLMRGRFGTEQHGGSHTSSDVFVLLDPALVSFLTVPVGNIGLEKLWRAVGKGKPIDAAEAMPFTYTGENLECRSPIRLRGSRNPGTLDWTLEWERRSRTPVEPFSGVATPLGETSEAYEVEIWDSGYTTLKRTITGLTSKSATWTAAQQITDFGDDQSTAYARVYQLSNVVGRGYPLQSSISQSLSPDPFIELLVLGLHFDGTNGSTTFTDEKGHTVTASGNAQISTAQSKFGGASGYFDGTNSGLTLASSADFNLCNTDSTIDVWLRPSGAGYRHICGFNNSTLDFWDLYVNPSNQIVFRPRGNGSDLVSSTAITNGSWAHLAVVTKDNVSTIYINGVSSGSTSGGITTANGAYVLAVGVNTYGNIAWFNGHMDDFRITRACRWTSAFTPPTEAFPNP